MSKHVTSDGARILGIASGQHSSEETSQRLRAVGDTVADLTVPVVQPQISRTDCNVLTTELTSRSTATTFA